MGGWGVYPPMPCFHLSRVVPDTINFSVLPCFAFGTGRGLVSATFLSRLFNGKLESCSIHTYCHGSFILLVITSVRSSFQTRDGKEVSIHMTYVILLLCQLANPLLSVHFIYTYVKCWQPHDNSLFSVDIGRQEGLKMIFSLPFLFWKRSFLSCVIHICKTNIYTCLKREMINNRKERDCKIQTVRQDH